jgi:peroxiredoxin
LNNTYNQIKELGAEILAIHVECSPAGTRRTAQRHKIAYPMANDDRLRVVGKYTPTSTYVIDAAGIIRARWHDQIHERVGADEILAVLRKIGEK